MNQWNIHMAQQLVNNYNVTLAKFRNKSYSHTMKTVEQTSRLFYTEKYKTGTNILIMLYSQVAATFYTEKQVKEAGKK